MIIREYKKQDADRVLELNESLVHFLSPLDKEKLESLVELSEMMKVVEVEGRLEAFLIAVREGTSYSSVNYRWFLEQYKKFLYIDRVVVSKEMHRKGIASKLYQQVFTHAKESGLSLVTAEIDKKPPNLVSLNFHKNFGFQEVDTQSIYEGKKLVSLQVASLE